MYNVISEADKNLLVSGIQSAATNQLDWRWFLGDLHRISGGARVHLSSMNTITKTPLDMMQIGFDPDYMDSLRQYYARLNLWAQRSNDTPVGVLRSTRQIASDEELKATEFYQDWIRPQENILGGGVVNLAHDHHHRFVIGGIIREVDREVLEPRFLAIMRTLIPHLTGALEVNKILGGQSLEKYVLREGMLPDSAACFVVSTSHKLIYANPLAEAMINKGDIVKCDYRSLLRLADTRANQKLASALFGFANSDTRFTPPFFAGLCCKQPTHICRVVKLAATDQPPAPYPFDRNGSEYTLLLMTQQP
ncbi:MAG: hypothetical protein ACU0CA_12010 [Paracoccaceae bacterium]